MSNDTNTVQTTGMTGLSAEMKTFYDMALVDEAQANLVHDQFGQKRPIPANGGKIIEFRKFAPLAKATTPLTEGVTPDGKQLSVSTVSAAVSQYGDYITQSDMLELTALDNTILESAKLLGRQAGATLDTVVRNVMHSGTNVIYAEKVTSSGVTEVKSRAALDSDCAITVELIQRAVAKLRAQNAPTINGKYVGIIHPYVAYDLMRDPEWVDAHKYAQPENLYEGEIGETVTGIAIAQNLQFNARGTAVGFGMAPTAENAVQLPDTWRLYAGALVLSSGSYGALPPAQAVLSPVEGQLYFYMTD